MFYYIVIHYLNNMLPVYQLEISYRKVYMEACIILHYIRLNLVIILLKLKSKTLNKNMTEHVWFRRTTADSIVETKRPKYTFRVLLQISTENILITTSCS